MSRVRTTVLLGLFVVLCLCVINWLQSPDDGAGVVLELKLEPARQVIKAGSVPVLTATLTNRSTRAVTLVEPGDGSECGWRTPMVEWIPAQPGGLRCGNMDGLRRGEVFRLKPGESRELDGSLGLRVVSEPGTYNWTLKYTNQPSHPCSGGLVSRHELGAMRMVRGSTPASVVSNPVEVVVEE